MGCESIAGGHRRRGRLPVRTAGTGGEARRRRRRSENDGAEARKPRADGLGLRLIDSVWAGRAEHHACAVGDGVWLAI